VIDQIRNWLYEPKVRGIDVDDANLLEIHSAVLQNKRLLKSAFETFYKDMSALSEKYFKVDGLEVEMGTGAGFFQSLKPSIITSDIRSGPNIDMELDAQNMVLETDSVRCMYAINVFHHLSNPNKFFNELVRVLHKGGGCILI
jgi:SAM-dependent methyltransferase